jgi:ABC-type multidrug transport system ATPase subunit
MGLLRYDSGSARVPVSDADCSIRIRRRIGFVTEDKELYPYMTVKQIIRFTRPYLPKWRRSGAALKMFQGGNTSLADSPDQPGPSRAR